MQGCGWSHEEQQQGRALFRGILKLYEHQELLRCHPRPGKRKAGYCHTRKLLLMALSQHSLTFIRLRLIHSCILLENRSIGASPFQAVTFPFAIISPAWGPKAFFQTEVQIKMLEAPNAKSLSRLKYVEVCPKLKPLLNLL